MYKTLFFFLLLLSAHLSAQAPRVGLVLSGGGAKGYAHVGVLKQLEKAGVQIDYISGSSMGAIVGALYACGYSADQLDSILQTTDIAAMLLDETPRQDLAFLTKQYSERYALSLSVEDFSPVVPAGFSSGQTIYNFFSSLTEHVHHIRDFSQLPIPFLCIATDLENGEAVTLDSGFLPDVVRASAAFPTLLTPIEIEGRLLSDGGIINNFPVREIQQRGVNYIIGVSVESGLLTKEELNSAPAILSQISSFQYVQNTQEQIGLCDILIHPEIEGYTITSFGDVDSIVHAGIVSALPYMDAFKTIAQQQSMRKGGRLTANTLRKLLPDSFQILNVGVEDIPENAEASLRNTIGFEKGDFVDYPRFYQSVQNLYSSGRYDRIGYQFNRKSEGTEVTLKPVLKKGYNHRVRLGVHYDNLYNTSLLFNTTALNLGLKNTILLLDLIVGDRFRYQLEYFMDRGSKLSPGIFSQLYVQALEARLPVSIPAGNDMLRVRPEFFVTDWSNALHVRLASNNNFAIGIKPGLKYYKVKSDELEELSTATLQSRGWFAEIDGYFHLDSRDRANFSRSGILAEAHLRPVYAIFTEGLFTPDDDWGYNIDIEFDLYMPLNEELTANIGFGIGVFDGENFAPYFYSIGGYNKNLINNFKSFPGLPAGAITGTDFQQGRLSFQYALLKNHFITVGGHTGWLQRGIDWEVRIEEMLYSGFIRYGISTPLGPVELTYAQSNLNGLLYFNLGYWF